MVKKQLKLNQNLFWDINPKQLDFKENKKFIISRILNYGDLNDFKQLKNYYNLRTIKQAACQSRELDKKSLNFYSLIFGLPKTKFLCSKTPLRQKQSVWLNR